MLPDQLARWRFTHTQAREFPYIPMCFWNNAETALIFTRLALDALLLRREYSQISSRCKRKFYAAFFSVTIQGMATQVCGL